MRRTLLPALAGILTLTLLASLAPPATAASAAIQTAEGAAVAWLATQQQDDGGFETAGFPGFETPDAVLAIAEEAQTGEAWDSTLARTAVTAAVRNGRNPLHALDDLVDAGTTGGQAAKLIALVVAPLGLDPTDFDPDNDSAAAVDLVAIMDAAKLADGSYGTGAVNATLFAALAHVAIGRRVPADTIAYVAAGQQTNGSWNYAGTPAGTGVDVDTTAYALMALVAAGRTRSDAAVSKALQMLAANQYTGGGWGDDYGSGPEVNTNSTALGALAVAAAGLDPNGRAWRDTYAPGRSGQPYVSPQTTLLAQQAADGHFGSPFDAYGLNTFATSQAVQGLLRRWLPLTAAAGPSRFVATPPTRVLDTRDGTGAPAARVGADSSVALAVAGAPSPVPAGATAVVVNVTGVSPTAATFVTVHPHGALQPWASNLNLVPGGTAANLVTVKVGTGGYVDLYNRAGQVDLVADIVGYYTDGQAPGAGYRPVTPARILDTRSGLGGTGGTVGEGEAITVTVAGVGSPAPADADAVVVNVTGTEPTRATHVTAWPAGTAKPLASNLNLRAGETRPNLVTVGVGDAGGVNLYNNGGAVHLIADVVGYYSGTDAGALRFVPTDPYRLYDSREANLPVSAGDAVTVDGAGTGPVPLEAEAIVANTTITQPSGAGHFTVYPADVPRPLASNLNFVAGQTVPNLVITGLDTEGRFKGSNNNGSTHVVYDVNGYFR